MENAHLSGAILVKFIKLGLTGEVCGGSQLFFFFFFFFFFFC